MTELLQSKTKTQPCTDFSPRKHNKEEAAGGGQLLGNWSTAAELRREEATEISPLGGKLMLSTKYH